MIHEFTASSLLFHALSKCRRSLTVMACWLVVGWLCWCSMTMAAIPLATSVSIAPAVNPARVNALGADVPTRADLQGRLDILTKQKDLSPAEQVVQQDLKQALAFLDALERAKQETAELKQRLTQVPAKLRQISEAVQNLRAGSDVVTRESLESLNFKQLEARLADTIEQLQSAQSDLSTFNSQLISLQTLPERAQNVMNTASQRLQSIRNQLNGVSPNQDSLRPTQQLLLAAEQAMLNARIELQRRNLEGNTTLQDLLQKQRDYTTAHITQLESVTQLLQELVNKKRLNLSEKTAREAQSPDSSEDIQNNLLVRQELTVNRQLSQRLIKSTEEENALIQQNIRVKNWLDRALQSERNLKEQITVLRGSLLLSRILYQQRQNLVPTNLMTDIVTRIADIRLAQFDLNQQRDQLFQGDDYIDNLIKQSKTPDDGDVRDALNQIIDIRRDLLDQLNKQLGNQLTLSIDLQVNQQQLLRANSSLQQTLTEQIFWVNSNKPIDFKWLTEFPRAIHAQFKNFSFTLTSADLLKGTAQSSFFLVPLLLIIVVIRLRHGAIDRIITNLNQGVGQLKRDSHTHTPLALLLTLLKALPIALLILGLGFWYYRLEVASSELIWNISQRLAMLWLVQSFVYRVLKSGGVAQRHFKLDASLCSKARKQVLRMGLAFIPLIFWAGIGELFPLYLVSDVVGQVVTILTLVYLAILLYPWCRDTWKDKNTHAIRLLMVTVISAMPLLLIVLMFAGYFYTTLHLTSRWIATVYLMHGWNVVYLTAMRGLNIAARRLAYRRALARRQNLIKEGGENSEPMEEPPLALEQVNQQSLRLTSMILFILFATGLYWVWADLITVISYLDSVSLWHYTRTLGGAAELQAVTLGNLLLAMAVVVVTYVLTRNLPGLLEVLVLSRLQLRQGTTYAMTTILSYLITTVGVLITLSSLGASWDRLQWLVAALSVGLGFGLQEIFANFISGMIILFERPVRIGDTITIGTFSGTVNKIRIRATTITDFDRKEVIIPNKTFVTERLTNWSLSDTVTRVLIKIGVAYGSDLDKVKEVLLQAAYSNARVMSDPEPQVFFLNFGTSTLDHELRFYVRELGDRSFTVDELNRSIERLCRENGINIAFNQLDVYLHDKQGAVMPNG